MDWKIVVSDDWSLLVDWLTNDVDDSTKSLGADWHLNWGASISDLLSSNKTLSGVQSDGSHVVTTKMLGDLEDQSVVDTLNLKGVEDRWKVALELHIDDGTNDLGDLTILSGKSSLIDLVDGCQGFLDQLVQDKRKEQFE